MQTLRFIRQPKAEGHVLLQLYSGRFPQVPILLGSQGYEGVSVSARASLSFATGEISSATSWEELRLRFA
jgi:hypothetical protein